MYVEIQRPLNVVGVVCFILPIDGTGCVRESWSLSFEHVLAMGEMTMLPGFGSVSVAALGCVSTNWHAHSLWRPAHRSSTDGTFHALKRAVDDNPLDLPICEDGEAGETMSAHVANQLDAMESAQSPIRLDNMASSEVNEWWQDRYEMSQKKMVELVRSLKYKYQALLSNEQKENQSLVEQIDRIMKDRVSENRSEGGPALQLKVPASGESLPRWSRWFLSDGASGDNGGVGLSVAQIAEGLAYAGIQLVSSHLGVGRIVVPPEKLEAYLDNPTAYIASLCNVSEAVYRNWRIHYNAPTCRAMVGGHLCTKPIKRVDSPANFVHGVSDCCADHKPQADQSSAKKQAASKPRKAS